MIADSEPASGGAGPAVAVVIPNWNGLRWLPGCLASLQGQSLLPAQVIVVDNGSRDGSLHYLRAEHPRVLIITLPRNTGFAHAANRGLEAAATELVALINTDVVLATDWIERMTRVLLAHPGAAAVAGKMLSLSDPSQIYDAGDVLRRDGVCEQRGRFTVDDGRFDESGEVFGACAGAALYRRCAVLDTGGFDERYFAYLEDVDLALRLRLAGWGCRYEPARSLHAGEGSSHQLRRDHHFLVARNTVLLVAKAFPVRWLPLVAYRQLAWLWHAGRERRLRVHLRGLAAAIPMLPDVLRRRRQELARARVPVHDAVPRLPWHGPRAGGHPAHRPTTLPAVPVTGERVTTAAAGFNPSFQRHRAEYRLCAALLGEGRVLDLGCGSGHSYEMLAPRETVGVDMDPAALAGQARETHATDMRELPFADGSFASVISIQAIEHVPDPQRVLAEVRRVLAPGGRAIFATPNRLTFGRPDEIIDPYHYVEYDAAELAALCRPFFDTVAVRALQVSDRYRAIHDDERRELDQLLARDPLRLRRLVPRRLRQRLYDWRLRRDRMTPRPGAMEIDQADFWLSEDGLERAIDLVAICDRG